MDKMKLINAGIDYDGSVNRFSGKADIYERYLKKFTSDETFRMLQSAVDAKDRKEAFLQAHTLYSTAGNLGIVPLAEKLKPVVETLRGGSFDGVEHAMTELTDIYNDIINVIDEAF